MSNLEHVCRAGAELAALEPEWVITIVQDGFVPDRYELEVVQGLPETICSLPMMGALARDADFAAGEWLRRRFREMDSMTRHEYGMA